MTMKLFDVNYMKFKLLLVGFFVLMLNTVNSYGQVSYLGLDGGLEGSATIDNVGTTGPAAGKWTKANATQTIANETTTVRSGVNSLRVNNSSTGRRVWSPNFTVSSTTSNVTVQYYKRVSNITNSQEDQPGIINNTEGLSGSYNSPASVANNWVKVTYTKSSSTFTTISGLFLHRQIGTGGDMFIDDMCVYTGAVDNTAPNSATAVVVNNPTISTLDVSWTAASGGVDGGGYIVVRYAVNPNADNDPNVNGIYAVGNTYTNGTGALVGTVVYNGTGISFTDTGLSALTTYYYKVYAYDKAYNYATEATGNNTTLSAGITSAQTGNWSDTATWVGGVVPTSADNAIIANGHKVTMDSATYRTRDSGTTTTVNAGGTLATGGLTYTNNGTTTVNGTFEINAGGFADGGNLTFGANGTLNFNTGGTYNVANTHTYWPAAAGKPKNVNIASGTTVVMANDAYRSIDTGGILSISGALTITTNPTITVNGTLRMDAGGYINTGAMPVYGSTSTLLYNTGGTYGRGFEWNAAGVGTIGTTQGYPFNVQLSNNTILNYLNTATSGAVGSKAMAGNLTIDSGSHLNMDYNTAPHIAAGGELVVAGNITIAGTLTLGFASGDDLRVTGNFTNTGTFAGNNRAVYFNKTGTQIVTSSSALTIPYLRTAGSGTTVQLAVGTSVIVSAPLTGNAIVFGNAADVIDINTTNTLTIGTDLIANTVSGSGTFKGSVSSNMTLKGTGSVGTLNFTTGSQNLGTFTMSRENGQTGCTMGTAVTINTALTLTSGLINLGNTTMTLVAGVNPTGSANSYVIADVSGPGYLRKNISALGSQTFPIGSGGTQYTPATINLTAGSLSSAYLSMAVENSKEPNMDAASIYLNRYWEVLSSGITSPTYTFTGTYVAADVIGGTTGNLSNQWNGSAWLFNNGSVIAGTVIVNGTTFSGNDHYTSGRRNQEINIKHVATNVPTGSTFTNFGTVTYGGTPVAITFTIENLGQNSLSLGTATLTGANYSTSYSYTNGSPGLLLGFTSTTFTVTVNPSATGVLTGSISIENTDSNENPYVINFQCTVSCPTATITSVTPASGPVGTNVTITAAAGPSASDFTGCTVNFGGVAATIISSSATQLVVTVPPGAVTGNINIVKTASSCVTSTPFTVIDRNGNCSFSDLIMTEIYDQDGGSLAYIEVYNGTGSTIDLTSYFIRRYGDNAAYIANTYTDYAFSPGIASIANGQVRYGRISADSNTASPNFDFSPLSGGINGDDILHLYRGATLVDVYIVPDATVGYTAKRKLTTLGPNITSNPSDWTHTNTETLADLGTFGVTLSSPPNVTTDPVDVTTCNSTATFTTAATAVSAGPLTYQWYYNSGAAVGWTAVAANSFAGVVASNFNTNTLTLAGAIGSFSGYQFYCNVIDNGACASASDAAQLYVNSTTWNGSAWSNGTPSLTVGAIINGAYDTAPAANGSFEACSLTILNTRTVTLRANTYIEIENDLFVNTGGSLLIENNGSLVMNNDAGNVTNNGTTQVTRTTAPFELYDYTYWSSPVDATDIATRFSTWRTDYSFEFNTANYSDTNTINSSGTITAAGVADSFDDFAPWAWLPYTGTMTNGKGYAIMGPTSLGTYPNTVDVTFSGKVNNGVVPIAIVESGNAANTADDFNLVGNPYPSAIWANEFINDNGTKTSGSLYFWTHVANVSSSNPGPDIYNFITDDYAVYNLSGGTRASFTGSAVPTGYIASGQGFFVEAQGNNTLNFNNSMRSKTHANNQFFRTSQPNGSVDRVWLNLRNTDGMFGQLLVAYFDDTTLDFDWAYDARVNQSNNYVSFYSLAANEKYKIQARPSFDDSDIVPIGYFSSVTGEFTISIDQKEGALDDESTNIYIEDLKTNIIHNLKLSPYVFTTEYGRFEDRFLLRYTDGSALNNPDFDTLSNSVVVASNHGQLTIKSYIQTMEEVTVYDVLGRQLFNQKGIGTNDLTASNISMSQQSVIVKIKLESGIIVTKKVLMN